VLDINKDLRTEPYAMECAVVLAHCLSSISKLATNLAR
jgi:hypothetical protein